MKPTPAHAKSARLRLTEEVAVSGPVAKGGDVAYSPGTEGMVVDHIVLDDDLAEGDGYVVYFLLLDDDETIIEAPEFAVEAT